MDLQAAIRFVSSHGDPAEQARLRFLTLGEPASPEMRRELFADQRRDGGWAPFWDPEYSSLDATCYRLSQARQLGLGGSEPEVGAALRFITGRQASHGSWEEDAAEAAVAPRWAAPGEQDAQLYLTANCGFWLAILGAAPPSAKLAAAFLLPYVEASGRMPTFLHAHWLAAALWRRLGQQAPAQKVLAYLSTQLSGLSEAGCAWLITALREAGSPVDLPVIQGALERLSAGQQPDGRWSSEDGSARDVHATLEALYALRLCGKANLGDFLL